MNYHDLVNSLYYNKNWDDFLKFYINHTNLYPLKPLTDNRIDDITKGFLLRSYHETFLIGSITEWLDLQGIYVTPVIFHEGSRSKWKGAIVKIIENVEFVEYTGYFNNRLEALYESI